MRRMITDTKNEVETIKKEILPEKEKEVKKMIKEVPKKSDIEEIHYKQMTLQKALDDVKKDSSENKRLLFELISSDYDSDGSKGSRRKVSMQRKKQLPRMTMKRRLKMM